MEVPAECLQTATLFTEKQVKTLAPSTPGVRVPSPASRPGGCRPALLGARTRGRGAGPAGAGNGAPRPHAPPRGCARPHFLPEGAPKARLGGRKPGASRRKKIPLLPLSSTCNTRRCQERQAGAVQRALWSNRGCSVGANVLYCRGPELRTPQEDEHRQLGSVGKSVSTCAEAALGVEALLSRDGHKVL